MCRFCLYNKLSAKNKGKLRAISRVLLYLLGRIKDLPIYNVYSFSNSSAAGYSSRCSSMTLSISVGTSER